MKLEIFPDAARVAQEAANRIAADARAAIAARGKFIVAVSGGTTPWQMLRHLALEELPWEAIHFVQVDERVAPAGNPDRNLTHLLEALSDQPRLHTDQIHAMPVEATALEAAAADYARQLQALTGSPPLLDLVHLGLGPDGHTASLVPGDPVLDVVDRDVAITGVYQGHRRMTLTYPVLCRARQILWLVTGESKQEMLARLCRGDKTIPAGRISRDQATILADTAAAGPLHAGDFDTSSS
jgi:6-phosphogluconolactonase